MNSLAGFQSSVNQADVRVTRRTTCSICGFGLDAAGWSAALFVDNLFNEYATVFFSERYTQARATVLPPRTFGINFRKNFDW